jgi:hypothetical protein
MTRFKLLLTLCLTLMAQNIYSQSVDSLPLKELNNEFLKGIKARERVVSLKTIILLDSQQLSLYKDTIVPNYKKALDTCKYEIVRLNGVIDRKDQAMKFYKYGFIGTTVLFILKLII